MQKKVTVLNVSHTTAVTEAAAPIRGIEVKHAHPLCKRKRETNKQRMTENYGT